MTFSEIFQLIGVVSRTITCLLAQGFTSFAYSLNAIIGQRRGNKRSRYQSAGQTPERSLKASLKANVLHVGLLEEVI